MDHLGLTRKFHWVYKGLTLYLIETPIDAFANRADPDKASLPDQSLLCLLINMKSIHAINCGLKSEKQTKVLRFCEIFAKINLELPKNNQKVFYFNVRNL